MKNYVASALIALIPSISFGLNETKIYRQNSETQIFVSYDDHGKFILDRYKVRTNQLQEKISQHYFANENLLREYQSESAKDMTLVTSSESLNFAYTEDNREIWETKNEWSWEWEIEYGRWLQSIDNIGYLYKYGVATDCADVAVAYRWIFARINGLPAGQTLAGTQVLFTNESMKNIWKDLPTSSEWHQDKLFLTALDYVLDNTYTHSIYKDSYPIEINRDAVIPGAHDLNLHSTDTGH
ncbi:MAG: hypothetical protein KDD25_07835, partial [Bdellovibrionales bacterium]|nr:hypothetical protein [Bdellovibrionales bacterium]